MLAILVMLLASSRLVDDLLDALVDGRKVMASS